MRVWGLLRQPLKAQHLQSHLCLVLGAARGQCQCQLPAPGPDLIRANESFGRALPLINISLSELLLHCSPGLLGCFSGFFSWPRFGSVPPTLGKCLWTSMEALSEHRMKSQPHHRVHLILGTHPSASYPRGTSFLEG